MSYEDQVHGLIKQSLDVNEGEEQIALREQAVRVADISGQIDLQYFARDQLVSACIFGGDTDKALVAYSWCLAQFDKHPGEFSQWSILWKYKWMIGLIGNFPQVPKERIYGMIDDLAERIQKAGYGMRAVYNQRYRLEKSWDNRATAIAYFRKMELEPRDEVSNCAACETDDRVSFSIYCGHDARALELASPIIEGQEKCGSVPHRTYANLLLPLVRLGRHEDALRFHQLGFGLVTTNKRYLDKLADHLILLALTENFKEAIALFEKYFHWSETSKDVLHRFRFFRAARLLFEMLTERHGQWPVDHQGGLQLTLPPSFPHYSETGRYHAAELAAWFKQSAAEIGRRFDERNETDFFARSLAETSSLKQLSRPVLLAAAAK